MTQGTTDEKNPRIWRCGDDFAHPIPPGTGEDSKSDSKEAFDKNHWKVVFDSYRDQDQKQCEMWKDEVNILLIFAGLFSAVVTAFIVESYKFLLPPDPSQPPSKFGPDSPHVIRLNSLWFCSLVLSLSTVVIGLVALQWIRNHQRYHDIKPRDALSVYEMRTKALRAWHIRWAFLSLPLLIIVALVLFFVGLVDFLLALNKKVAAPVAVLIYVTLALLLITTILPSFQILTLYVWAPDVKTETDMPSPCPYKSPQSLIFHRFVTLLIFGFRHVKRKLFLHQKVVVDEVSLRALPLYFMFYTSPSKWTDYDIKWLRLRDMYSQAMEGNHQQSRPFTSLSLQHSRRPVFDEAQILKDTVTGSRLDPSADALFAAYHCFQEISKNALYQGIESTEDNVAPKYDERNLILRSYYWKRIHFGPPISDLVKKPSAHLLHDENMLVFLQMHSSHNLPEKASRIISAHLLELQARILAHTYATEPAALRFGLPSGEPETSKESPKKSPKLQWLNMMSQQYIDMINSTDTLPNFKVWSQFTPRSLNGNEITVSHDTIRETIVQCSMVFELFLRHVVNLKPSDWKKTIYAHRNVAQFAKVPAAMLRYRESAQSPFNVFSRFEDSFSFIQTTLSNFANTQSLDSKTIDHKPLDYLFLTGCLLIEHVFHPYTTPALEPFNKIEQRTLMADLITALSAYEQTDNAPDRIQETWTNLWSNTDLPKEPAFKSKSAPTKFSYIRWEYIPPWIKIDFTAPLPTR